MSDEEEKELNEIDEQIIELKKEELRDQKKKKKLAEKERRKLREKMDLKMILERNDDPGIVDESAMFSLSLIKSKTELNKVVEQTPEILAESEDENDGIPKVKKVKFDKEKTYLDSSGKYV